MSNCLYRNYYIVFETRLKIGQILKESQNLLVCLPYDYFSTTVFNNPD